MRRLLGRARPPDGFDAAFYRANYRDLADQGSDAALAEHYLRHGRGEGRVPNAASLIAALEGQHGKLPDDFVPGHYRARHQDLQGMVEPWQLAEHYLRFGRREGRAYRFDLDAYERDFLALRAGPGEGRTGPASFAGLLAAARVRPGGWLGRFVLHEFVILNAGWLPRPPASRIDGLRAFLEDGIDRLAPIALGLSFDPAFHRAQGWGGAEADDADLYRAWLGSGLDLGRPADEGAALTALVGDATFPEAFDETAYRAAIPRGLTPPAPGRLGALTHFVQIGFSRLTAEIVAGPGAADLFERVAEYHLARGNPDVARRAFDRAVALRPDLGRLRHRRGDALRLLDRAAEAGPDFVAAAEGPGATAWTHLHAAEADLAGEGGPRAALDRLLRAAPGCRGEAGWRAAVPEVLDQAFAAASREAHALYARGERASADALLGACIDGLRRVIEAVEVLPAPFPPPGDGAIVLLANRDLPQCDHYRVVQKRAQLEHGGWRVALFALDEARAARAALDRARALIVYRAPATPPVLHAILYARALGLPTIYEVDDLIFDARVYPDPFESFEGAITAAEYAGLQYGVPLFRAAMALCDVGLASTSALAEAMRPIVRGGVCHVLRNGLDARNAPFLARPHVPFAAGWTTIFYGSGTKAHNRDFSDLAAPALLDVLARHPRVRLAVAGYLPFDPRFAPFADRVRSLGFTPDVRAYWEALSGADINLAVLAPGTTTDAKSEIKWLEAAMCGIPSIVSDTRTYREVLVHGQTALVARTPQDWREALDALVGDPELRRAIGARARARAVEGYGLDAAVPVLAGMLPPPGDRRAAPGGEARDLDGDDLDAAPRPPPRPAGGRPRLLIVHVFFPPQLIGGATRVVRDNLDHLLDHAADRYEVAVLTTDENAEPPYATRIDSYRGVPVYRIAPPRGPQMTWRPFDPRMGRLAGEVLDRFAPDLVHVHCLQHLTASVVEAVRARAIPYVVTLHDAWWISDFQFITDADGQAHTPSPDALADATDRTLAPVASIGRRRALGRLLDGARVLAAVSESFAALYRAAGHERTVAIPNGLPMLAPVPRRPSPTGRVRLGHVGNRATHKGATLVEAVLRGNAFRNLALTIVEHARRPGESRDETWGTTPVRIVGRVPQAAMADLYADLDVLLAPSLWPESFGLVTREAQAAGLWVVASDRGAIGEAVREGVDGFRIDVGVAEPLRAVLARIDADPARFLASPPPLPTSPRTSADQGADLLALYRRLLAEPPAP